MLDATEKRSADSTLAVPQLNQAGISMDYSNPYVRLYNAFQRGGMEAVVQYVAEKPIPPYTDRYSDCVDVVNDTNRSLVETLDNFAETLNSQAGSMTAEEFKILFNRAEDIIYGEGQGLKL